MAKDKKIFVCSECGYESPKYWGKCPDCGKWNTFSEFSKKELDIVNNNANIVTPKVKKLNDISADDDIRFSTSISELDRVLGGGIVASSLVLVGGEPGIGKSTLLMQTAYNISLTNRKVLYASSEESLTQLKLRLDRLKPVSYTHLCLPLSISERERRGLFPGPVTGLPLLPLSIKASTAS